MTSALSLSSNIVHQALDNLFTTITEHRWQEALSLLPSVVAFAKFQVSPYFTWKVLHIIMANTHIPSEFQMQILNVMLMSSIKSYTAVLDMFGYKFGDWEDDKIETIYEAIKKEPRGLKKADRKMLFICRAYYALHHYLKWKKILLSLSNGSTMADQKREIFDDKKCKKLAFKVHSMLTKAYSLSLCSAVDKDNSSIDLCNSTTLNHSEIENSTISDKENKADGKIMCEWLLGPLLDLEAYLSIKNEFSVCIDTSRSVDRFHGIELIEAYIKNHKNHLPALRTYYFYLTTHHLDEKRLIQKVLEKIVALSPESSLVLQYVHNILPDCIGGNQDEKNKKNICRLTALNQEDLFKCLKILSNFLEYQMWRTDVRAWMVFVDILKVFHQCWIRCWNCERCTSSRDRMSEFSDSLSSWPNFLWNANWLSSLTKEDTDVLTYAGYSSFLLGYSDQISKHCVQCLEVLNCKKDIINLVNIMRLEGNHYRDLLVYLAKQRKKRLLTQSQEKPHSSNNIVTRKGLKFGSDYIFKSLNTSKCGSEETVKSIPNNIAKERNSETITENVKNKDATSGIKKDGKAIKSSKPKVKKSATKFDDHNDNSDGKKNIKFKNRKSKESSLTCSYPVGPSPEDTAAQVSSESSTDTNDVNNTPLVNTEKFLCFSPSKSRIKIEKTGKENNNNNNIQSGKRKLVEDSENISSGSSHIKKKRKFSHKSDVSDMQTETFDNTNISIDQQSGIENLDGSSYQYDCTGLSTVKNEDDKFSYKISAGVASGKQTSPSQSKFRLTQEANKSTSLNTSNNDSSTVAFGRGNNSKPLNISNDISKVSFGRENISKLSDTSNNESCKVSFGRGNISKSPSISNNESSKVSFGKGNISKSPSVNNNDSSKVSFGRGNISKSPSVNNNESSKVSFGRGNNSKSPSVNNNESSKVSFGKGNISKSPSISNNVNSKVSFGRGNISKSPSISNNENSKVSFARGNNSKSPSISNNESSKVSFGRRNNSKSPSVNNNESSKVSFGRGNNSKSPSISNNENSKVSFGRRNNSKSPSVNNNESSKVSFGRGNNSNSPNISNNESSKVSFGRGNNSKSLNTSNNNRANFYPGNSSKPSNMSSNDSRISFGRNNSNSNSSRISFGRGNSKLGTNNTDTSKVIFGSKGKNLKFNTSPDQFRRKGTYNKFVKYYTWC